MKLFKKIFFLLLIFLGISAIFVWWSNHEIEKSTKSFTTSQIENVPNRLVGVVLGTSKTLSNGTPNLYFKYRIDAAEQLYKSGKVKFLIVSGDNSVKHYNEPEDMMNELVSRGIPKEKIFMDYAGFRTLDSVVRAKEIFGQDSYIVISQKFHNMRAIYLAQKNGIDAFGFNAKDVHKSAGLKTKLREKFARAKVFVDLLLEVNPKYGGEKVVIE